MMLTDLPLHLAYLARDKGFTSPVIFKKDLLKWLRWKYNLQVIVKKDKDKWLSLVYDPERREIKTTWSNLNSKEGAFNAGLKGALLQLDTKFSIFVME